MTEHTEEDGTNAAQRPIPDTPGQPTPPAPEPDLPPRPVPEPNQTPPPIPPNPKPGKTPEPTPEPVQVPPPAQRALAEAEERRRKAAKLDLPPELGGRDGPEPVRYGDWEKKGIAVDF